MMSFLRKMDEIVAYLQVYSTKTTVHKLVPCSDVGSIPEVSDKHPLRKGPVADSPQ